MNLKSKKVQKYWGKQPIRIDYSQIDQLIIKEFVGEHPFVIKKWLPKENEVYKANPNHVLTHKQKKHRRMIQLENIFGFDLSKKHYKLVK